MAAALCREREARLLRLPRFTFTGGGGSTNLSNASVGVAAGVFAPLYTGGAISAQIEAATAAQKASVARYAAAGLRAFREVETALADERLLEEREACLTAVVRENLGALEISRKQYEVGKVDLLDVLIVQNDWIAARIALLDASADRLVDRVTLHLALGGSFQ